MQLAVDSKGVVTPDVAASALPAGFPFLVLDHTEEIVEPTLLFMTERYLASGRRFVADTAKAVAEDLRDWWTYLLEFERRWDEATTEDVTTYRDVMEIGRAHV